MDTNNIDTADRMELVISQSGDTKQGCLFAILNHCCTNAGKRQLRANILQPSCSEAAVESRLDCVQEFIDKPIFHNNIRSILFKLTDVDQLLMFGAVIPQSNLSVSDRQLNYILQLKSTIELVKPITTELSVAAHPTFRVIYQNMTKFPFKQISELISTMIQGEAHPVKGQGGHIQRCFAIKSGLNGLLDITRKTYTEIIDDMRDYVEKLSAMHNLPLKINYNCRKGYHITMSLYGGLRNMRKDDLPQEFIQVDRLTNSFSMTTMELVHFDHRVKHNLDGILSLSNVMIHQLMMDLREYVSDLYKLCDDVALLDILQSLAQASLSGHNYVRPEISKHYMELKDSRHPLLDYLYTCEPVGNPVFASDFYNFHLITGPNMSGKSVYIRQIILIQIMGQVGAFVPASKAVLRLSNHIVARIGQGDNLECNASSFVLEMKEMQYIFNSMTDRSLIIIDELCRSTSVDEGTSIAYAISENLLKTKAFTFFVTHFLYLTKLSNHYYNVINWQLQTLEDENRKGRLKYTHHLKPGITSIENYGIKIAKYCAVSKIIVQEAEEILEQLKPLNKDFSNISKSPTLRHMRYKLTSELRLLEHKESLTKEIYLQKVADFERRMCCKFQPLDQITSVTSSSPIQVPQNQNEIKQVETRPNRTIENEIRDISIYESNDDSERESSVNKSTFVPSASSKDHIFSSLKSSRYATTNKTSIFADDVSRCNKSDINDRQINNRKLNGVEDQSESSMWRENFSHIGQKNGPSHSKLAEDNIIKSNSQNSMWNENFPCHNNFNTNPNGRSLINKYNNVDISSQNIENNVEYTRNLSNRNNKDKRNVNNEDFFNDDENDIFNRIIDKNYTNAHKNNIDKPNYSYRNIDNISDNTIDKAIIDKRSISKNCDGNNAKKSSATNSTNSKQVFTKIFQCKNRNHPENSTTSSSDKTPTNIAKDPRINFECAMDFDISDNIEDIFKTPISSNDQFDLRQDTRNVDKHTTAIPSHIEIKNNPNFVSENITNSISKRYQNVYESTSTSDTSNVIKKTIMNKEVMKQNIYASTSTSNITPSSERIRDDINVQSKKSDTHSNLNDRSKLNRNVQDGHETKINRLCVNDSSTLKSNEVKLNSKSSSSSDLRKILQHKDIIRSAGSSTIDSPYLNRINDSGGAEFNMPQNMDQKRNGFKSMGVYGNNSSTSIDSPNLNGINESGLVRGTEFKTPQNVPQNIDQNKSKNKLIYRTTSSSSLDSSTNKINESDFNSSRNIPPKFEQNMKDYNNIQLFRTNSSSAIEKPSPNKINASESVTGFNTPKNVPQNLDHYELKSNKIKGIYRTASSSSLDSSISQQINERNVRNNTSSQNIQQKFDENKIKNYNNMEILRSNSSSAIESLNSNRINQSESVRRTELKSSQYIAANKSISKNMGVYRTDSSSSLDSSISNQINESNISITDISSYRNNLQKIVQNSKNNSNNMGIHRTNSNLTIENRNPYKINELERTFNTPKNVPPNVDENKSKSYSHVGLFRTKSSSTIESVNRNIKESESDKRKEFYTYQNVPQNIAQDKADICKNTEIYTTNSSSSLNSSSSTQINESNRRNSDFRSSQNVQPKINQSKINDNNMSIFGNHSSTITSPNCYKRNESESVKNIELNMSRNVLQNIYQSNIKNMTTCKIDCSALNGPIPNKTTDVSSSPNVPQEINKNKTNYNNIGMYGTVSSSSIDSPMPRKIIDSNLLRTDFGSTRNISQKIDQNNMNESYNNIDLYRTACGSTSDSPNVAKINDSELTKRREFVTPQNVSQNIDLNTSKDYQNMEKYVTLNNTSIDSSNSNKINVHNKKVSRVDQNSPMIYKNIEIHNNTSSLSNNSLNPIRTNELESVRTELNTSINALQNTNQNKTKSYRSMEINRNTSNSSIDSPNIIKTIDTKLIRNNEFGSPQNIDSKKSKTSPDIITKTSSNENPNNTKIITDFMTAGDILRRTEYYKSYNSSNNISRMNDTPKMNSTNSSYSTPQFNLHNNSEIGGKSNYFSPNYIRKVDTSNFIDSKSSSNYALNVQNHEKIINNTEIYKSNYNSNTNTNNKSNNNSNTNTNNKTSESKSSISSNSTNKVLLLTAQNQDAIINNKVYSSSNSLTTNVDNKTSTSVDSQKDVLLLNAPNQEKNIKNIETYRTNSNSTHSSNKKNDSINRSNRNSTHDITPDQNNIKMLIDINVNKNNHSSTNVSTSVSNENLLNVESINTKVTHDISIDDYVDSYIDQITEVDSETDITNNNENINSCKVMKQNINIDEHSTNDYIKINKSKMVKNVSHESYIQTNLEANKSEIDANTENCSETSQNIAEKINMSTRSRILQDVDQNRMEKSEVNDSSNGSNNNNLILEILNTPTIGCDSRNEPVETSIEKGIETVSNKADSNSNFNKTSIVPNVLIKCNTRSFEVIKKESNDKSNSDNNIEAKKSAIKSYIVNKTDSSEVIIVRNTENFSNTGIIQKKNSMDQIVNDKSNNNPVIIERKQSKRIIERNDSADEGFKKLLSDNNDAENHRGDTQVSLDTNKFKTIDNISTLMSDNIIGYNSNPNSLKPSVAKSHINKSMEIIVEKLENVQDQNDENTDKSKNVLILKRPILKPAVFKTNSTENNNLSKHPSFNTNNFQPSPESLVAPSSQVISHNRGFGSKNTIEFPKTCNDLKIFGNSQDISFEVLSLDDQKFVTGLNQNPDKTSTPKKTKWRTEDDLSFCKYAVVDNCSPKNIEIDRKKGENSKCMKLNQNSNQFVSDKQFKDASSFKIMNVENNENPMKKNKLNHDNNLVNEHRKTIDISIQREIKIDSQNINEINTKKKSNRSTLKDKFNDDKHNKNTIVSNIVETRRKMQLNENSSEKIENYKEISFKKTKQDMYSKFSLKKNYILSENETEKDRNSNKNETTQINGNSLETNNENNSKKSIKKIDISFNKNINTSTNLLPAEAQINVSKEELKNNENETKFEKYIGETSSAFRQIKQISAKVDMKNKESNINNDSTLNLKIGQNINSEKVLNLSQKAISSKEISENLHLTSTKSSETVKRNNISDKQEFRLNKNSNVTLCTNPTKKIKLNDTKNDVLENDRNESIDSINSPQSLQQNNIFFKSSKLVEKSIKNNNFEMDLTPNLSESNKTSGTEQKKLNINDDENKINEIILPNKILQTKDTDMVDVDESDFNSYSIINLDTSEESQDKNIIKTVNSKEVINITTDKYITSKNEDDFERSKTHSLINLNISKTTIDETIYEECNSKYIEMKNGNQNNVLNFSFKLCNNVVKNKLIHESEMYENLVEPLNTSNISNKLEMSVKDNSCMRYGYDKNNISDTYTFKNVETNKDVSPQYGNNKKLLKSTYESNSINDEKIGSEYVFQNNVSKHIVPKINENKDISSEYSEPDCNSNTSKIFNDQTLFNDCINFGNTKNIQNSTNIFKNIQFTDNIYKSATTVLPEIKSDTDHNKFNEVSKDKNYQENFITEFDLDLPSKNKVQNEVTSLDVEIYNLQKVIHDTSSENISKTSEKNKKSKAISECIKLKDLFFKQVKQDLTGLNENYLQNKDAIDKINHDTKRKEPNKDTSKKQMKNILGNCIESPIIKLSDDSNITSQDESFYSIANTSLKSRLIKTKNIMQISNTNIEKSTILRKDKAKTLVKTSKNIMENSFLNYTSTKSNIDVLNNSKNITKPSLDKNETSEFGSKTEDSFHSIVNTSYIKESTLKFSETVTTKIKPNMDSSIQNISFLSANSKLSEKSLLKSPILKKPTNLFLNDQNKCSDSSFLSAISTESEQNKPKKPTKRESEMDEFLDNIKKMRSSQTSSSSSYIFPTKKLIAKTQKVFVGRRDKDDNMVLKKVPKRKKRNKGGVNIILEKYLGQNFIGESVAGNSSFSQISRNQERSAQNESIFSQETVIRSTLDRTDDI